MRPFPVLVIAVAALSSSLASAQGWNPEFRSRMGEEIRENEARAQALNPIIARNKQARTDMVADVEQLSGQARGMRERARWFRESAAGMDGRYREHFVRQAEELERSARTNDQLAAGQKDLAARLEATIHSLDELRLWHIEVARHLRESLEWR